jgi:hypothetical protein
MAWKKYFKTANVSGSMSPINGATGTSAAIDPGYRNFASKLPEVYIGHPNRVERYNQYEQMDMDSEINAALDIIADFCTQLNDDNGTGFDLYFKDKPTDNEVKILKDQLLQWVTLNKLNKRLFKLVRNTIKYGDQVFLRDPETFELYWTEMHKVIKVIVNEAEGKEPEQYVIKDLNINFQNLTATAVSASDTYVNHPQVGGPSGAYVQPNVPYSGGTRFSHAQNEAVINAEHVMHLSLTEGLDLNWPFGNSVLESVFKIFKQKELLEDAIIIYRIQRAPERRIFKIDVGNMPTHMAMAFVDRIKNEIHQRRIPTQTGGGGGIHNRRWLQSVLRVQVPIARRLLAHLERLTVQHLCFLVFTLGLQHRPQRIDALERSRVPIAERSTAHLERLAEQLLRLLVFALFHKELPQLNQMLQLRSWLLARLARQRRPALRREPLAQRLRE